jgi:predicted nucleic acid-binding protein
MKYVLYASVALKWVLKEPDSFAALALREEFKHQVYELVAPDAFLAEVGHALTRAERRGIIKPPEASAYFSDVISTPPDLRSIIPLLPRALELSSSARIGVYGGTVHCLDANTGHVHWTHDLQATVWCAPLIADGMVYVPDEEGRVTIFELAPQKKLVRVIEMDDSLYATPVAAEPVCAQPFRMIFDEDRGPIILAGGTSRRRGNNPARRVARRRNRCATTGANSDP